VHHRSNQFKAIQCVSKAGRTTFIYNEVCLSMLAKLSMWDY
jgi:hypothetical protein